MGSDCSTYNFNITRGSTFARTFRWEISPLVWVAISNMLQSAPIRISALLHGLTPGWRVAVVDAVGMDELNAKNSPPTDDEMYQATVIDANQIELNEISSLLFDAYVSGGALAYWTAKDLTGYIARMSFKDSYGGTLLASFASPAEIVIDNVNKTITLTIDAATTAAFTFDTAVYDLEMESPGGEVTKISKGQVYVKDEVTT